MLSTPPSEKPFKEVVSVQAGKTDVGDEVDEAGDDTGSSSFWVALRSSVVVEMVERDGRERGGSAVREGDGGREAPGGKTEADRTRAGDATSGSVAVWDSSEVDRGRRGGGGAFSLGSSSISIPSAASNGSDGGAGAGLGGLASSGSL